MHHHQQGLARVVRCMAGNGGYAVFLLPKGMTEADLPAGPVSSIEAVDKGHCQNGQVCIGAQTIPAKCITIHEQSPAIDYD